MPPTGASPRSPVAPPTSSTRLAPQDGLYTLIERGADGDHAEVVPSIVRVAPGDDVTAFVAALADPDVVILTLTITEAGYRLDRDGRLDTDDPDVRARHRAAAPRRGRRPGDRARPHHAGARPPSPRRCATARDRPVRQHPRQRPCGRAALREFAELAAPAVAAWLADGVRLVSTSVDRITPRMTDADRQALRALTGWIDEAPVVTEPFSDWVLSGEFPSGRPDWEAAGARFVDDIEPWEHRKLWMLNGAHTLVALLGGLRGHALVAEAIADPVVLAAVERLWDEDARHLPDLGLEHYRAALLERFRNPRIAHHLDQISTDSQTKLRLRIVPVALRERAAGAPASACATVIAAWILSIGAGRSPLPADRAETPGSAGLVSVLDAQLGADPAFCSEVERAVAALADSLH